MTMMTLRSARSRIVLVSALLGLVAMALVLGLVYWTVNRLIETQTRNAVTVELNGLSESYAGLGTLGLARGIERRIRSDADPDALYLLTDPLGQRIAGNLGVWPTTVEPGDGWVTLELIRTDIDRLVPISAASIELRGGERLLVGRDASARQRFDRILGQSLALALATSIALSLVTGWLLTRLVFRRVGEISETARDIMSGDLARRIPTRPDGDEFDRVGTTLNAMLDRIETLVANMRMTTNSLSHDLRSPLTRLRGQIDRLRTGDLAPEARETLAEQALREVDHVLRMFSDLTEIARAEAGIGRDAFERLDLAELACDLADFYAPLAMEEGKSVTVLTETAPVDGHRTLLNQALSNVMENAMRHAPVGSDIVVRSEMRDGDVVISIADGGSGIPVEERARSLEPFVRLDDSRPDRHAGLGLALVASVMHLHGGTVTLEDNGPGLVVILAFPGAAAPQEGALRPPERGSVPATRA